MTNSADFWNKAAAKYAKSDIKDMASYEHTMERTKSYLNAGDRALEVGCGTGSTALLLAPCVAELRGTDISEEMIKIAREKAREAGCENVTFEVSRAENTGAEEADFDAILGFNLFHLADDPQGSMRHIYGRLRPGGVFISKTPCLGDPAVGLKRYLFGAFIAVGQFLGKVPKVHAMTFDELEAMIAAAGFEIVETGNFPAMSRFVVARKAA